MKVKSLLITIVINIFLMLMVSVLYEYINLSERFQQLENNVSMALEQAINTSVSSEELFSNEYQMKVASFGSTTGKGTTSNTVLYWNNGWNNVNPYFLAMYYDKNNKYPSMTELNNFISSESTTTSHEADCIYEWLYGGVHSDYNDGALSWANKNSYTRNESEAVNRVGSNRLPTDKFREFYENIGKSIVTTGIVKAKNADGSYSIVNKEYPVLTNMGLNLNDLNEVSSTEMMDNFCMSYHIGRNNKTASGTVIQKTKYYLSPASLGVTYVPIEVLKPMFVTNLDTLIRLQKLASADLKPTTDVNSIFNSASGCISTEVYNGGTAEVHTGGKSEVIVNDGVVEYDLSSAMVRVDYFKVDFWDTKNKDIVARVNGSIGGYNFDGSDKGLSSDTLLSDTVTKMKSTDTGYRYLGNNVNGDRIVARVTVRLKVHVCYDSSILQWLCKRFTGGSKEHYDIKLWDESASMVSNEDDGVWFQYTTYYANTR